MVSFTELITTVGGEDSNSYGTLEELKNYFAHRTEAASFLEQEDDVLIARLIQAAFINDTLLTPYGKRVSDSQSLSFPREGLFDKHGRKYSNSVIPDKIKFAQFEQALYCATNNIMLPSILTQGFSEAKLDVMSIKLNKDFVPRKLSYDAVDFLSLFGEVDASFGGDVNIINVTRY